MDSSGIGVIMGRYQKLRLLGGSVAATHVSDRIWRILHLAGVVKLHFYALIVTSKLFFDNKRLMNDFEVFSVYV